MKLKHHLWTENLWPNQTNYFKPYDETKKGNYPQGIVADKWNQDSSQEYHQKYCLKFINSWKLWNNLAQVDTEIVEEAIKAFEKLQY